MARTVGRHGQRPYHATDNDAVEDGNRDDGGMGDSGVDDRGVDNRSTDDGDADGATPGDGKHNNQMGRDTTIRVVHLNEMRSGGWV